ncbi:MAG: cytochrome c3 family protein, partial [Candidatus Latescibacteria bacterium]|nr:cytochrome c3 family protein [Candidatus Latescibacterota bacterium]
MRQGSRYWVVVGTVALLLGWWGMVRGVPSTTIRFSHKLHLGEDVEAECTMCHPAEESASASDRLLPTMEICGECHDVEDDDGCATCHLDLDIVGEIDVPSREIVFSHQSHLGYDGTACTTCHAGLEEVEA